MNLVISAMAGLLFGLGMIVSGMINPAKVLNFLDLAGHWDPSLAFVMAGAIAVGLPGYRLVARMDRPLFSPRFLLPTRSDLSPDLVIGAAVFGVGWGIAGFCPGPALTALTLGRWPVLLFCVAMLTGMLLGRHIRDNRLGPAAPAGPPSTDSHTTPAP